MQRSDADLIERGLIQTYTGRFVDPLDMKADDIVLEDIAHALANICRFTGHCSRFYSVAEHSLNVMNIISSMNYPRTIKLAALLHDASEAYLCDLARPLKERPEFQFYRDAEAQLQSMIDYKYGALEDCMDGIIHKADEIALGLEARDLMGGLRPWRKEGSRLRVDSTEREFAKWVKHWPSVRVIPDELYYAVDLTEPPTIALGGLTIEEKWLKEVRGLMVASGPKEHKWNAPLPSRTNLTPAPTWSRQKPRVPLNKGGTPAIVVQVFCSAAITLAKRPALTGWPFRFSGRSTKEPAAMELAKLVYLHRDSSADARMGGLPLPDGTELHAGLPGRSPE